MKTFISSDLVHIALIVSLLRLFPELCNNPRWGSESSVREVFLGASSAYTQTNFHNVHNRLDGYIDNKNIDNILSRSLFNYDLGAFTRSSRRNDIFSLQNNVIAYIVNSQHQTVPLNGSEVSSENRLQNNSGNGRATVEENVSESITGGSDLTQEDMDLIEILWKQDIDLGISREVFDGTWSSSQDVQKPVEQIQTKEIENVKDPDQESNVCQEPEVVPDPWQGLQYTIDSETGEHIIHNPPCPADESSSIQLPPDALQNFSLQEALQLFEGDTYRLYPPVQQTPVCQELENDNQNELVLNDPRYLLEQLHELERLSLEARNDAEPPTVMETEWSTQPLPSASADMQMALPQTSTGFSYEPMNISDSSLFQSGSSLDDVLLRNSTMPSVNQSANYSSAVTDFQMQPVDDRKFLEFLEMLSNGSDPDFGTVGSPMNEQINDFFGTNLTNGVSDYLSQLLEDDGLDLMDFSSLPEVSDSILPDKSEETTAKDEVQYKQEMSNDSAISCMSSESPRSDSDWNDSGSGTSHSGDTDSEYHYASQSSSTKLSKKYTEQWKSKHFHATATPSIPRSNSSNDNMDELQPSENAYVRRRVSSSHTSQTDSDSGTFVHNHTYHLPPSDNNSLDKPVERDKKYDKSERSRDGRKAKALKIPLSNFDIINLSIEEFNELLAKHDLTDAQLTLIRDIRRRGKNKVAAQNCRKRKLNQIFDLQIELEDIQSEKAELEMENREMLNHHQLLKQKYDRLYQFVFQSPGPPDPHGFNSQMNEHESMRSVFQAGANSTSQDCIKDSKNGARTKRKQDKK